MIGYFGECKWRGSTRLQMLTLLILVGIVNSMDVSTTLSSTHKEPTDSIKSIDLKMEARNDEISHIIEIPEATNEPTKVHPVYPESRANFETKLSANPSGAWKSVMKTSSKDSYLDALNHSHLKNYQPDVSYNNKKLLRRKYESPVYRPTSLNIEISKEPKTYVTPTADTFSPTPSESYSLPINEATNFNEQNQYGTLENYNDYEVTQYNYNTPSQNYAPSQNLAPSQNYYGNSQPTYEAPSQSYGASVNTAYGPPKQSYGTPVQHQGHEVSNWNGYQFPNLIQLPSLSSIGLAWPLAIKLNAFTVAKIILKLVIFKMIVKFIAVMCLLLFIPKLKANKEGKDDDEGDDDDRRSAISEDLRTQKLNVLTANVLESIEKYETKNGTVEDDDNCSSFSCRLRRLIGTGDTWDDYFKLFNSYAAEEEDEDEAEEEEDEEKIDEPIKKNTTEKKT